MAEGGHKSFTASVYKGSEEVFDFVCTPCGREGNNIEAVNFCMDCTEYYCLACTKHHLKFGVTSNHNVVNKSKASKAGTSKKSPAKVTLPTETCSEHGEERITTYCADHDKVACNTCISVDHRLCDDVNFIPKICDGSKTSPDVPRVKQKMTDTLQTINTAQISLQKSKSTADEDKQKHLHDIKQQTDRLVQHARDMEKTAIDDVNTRHKEATDALTEKLTSLDETKVTIENRVKNLNNAHKYSDAQVFVDIKMGLEEVKTAKQFEESLHLTDTENVRSIFVIDDQVDSFASSVSSLGKVVAQKPYRAVLASTHDIGSDGEEYYSGICDMCELPDGRILMTDYINVCIKTVDMSYKVTQTLKMPSIAWGICQTSQSDVAVTMTENRKVQFMDISGSLKATTSFAVEDYCRGIAYSKGELFVSCGGGPHTGGNGFDAEGPGFVGVYDIHGSLLRKFQCDGHNKRIFSLPRSIAISTNGNKIHISDEKRGVVTIDRLGHVLSAFCENVQQTRGICTAKNENLIVCGCNSNNLVQLNTHGEFVAELLGQKDGLIKPFFVRFSHTASSLAVAFNESDQIKIFNLV